ncbi:hypothetical protein HDU86_000978 [Geranomyces michiganensis]|nr:hypothetical protein HDU86_000978 [Geranomyces michiganensis]
MRVLTVGSNGRVGQAVLTSLLADPKTTSVHAVVRDASKLKVAANPKLTVVEASLLDLPQADLANYVASCDAVVCTLGHNLSWGRVPVLGIWAAPRDLVTQATRKIHQAIVASNVTASPKKFVLLGTIGVTNPDGSDSPAYTRTTGENVLISTLRALTPPYADSCTSIEYVVNEIGNKDADKIEWCVVRPDGFLEKERSEYHVNPAMDHPMFKPQKTTIANIGHFMSQLVLSSATWNAWKGKMPVIIDKVQEA